MLAAIVGTDRSSYYDILRTGNSAIAITPLSDLRTVNIPAAGLGTDPKQNVTETTGSWRTYKLTYQNTTGGRQLHSCEAPTDPAYRIDVAPENEKFYDSPREHLVNGTSIYPPSLDKSEYLAVIENVEADREPEV